LAVALTRLALAVLVAFDWIVGSHRFFMFVCSGVPDFRAAIYAREINRRRWKQFQIWNFRFEIESTAHDEGGNQNGRARLRGDRGGHLRGVYIGGRSERRPYESKCKGQKRKITSSCENQLLKISPLKRW